MTVEASSEFKPHPIVAEAIKALEERIDNFRGKKKEEEVNQSSILGEIHKDRESYVVDSSCGKINLPAHIVGELFLHAVGKFNTEITDLALLDLTGKTRTGMRVFQVKGEDVAFILRQEFTRGDWTSTYFEIARSIPLR